MPVECKRPCNRPSPFQLQSSCFSSCLNEKSHQEHCRIEHPNIFAKTNARWGMQWSVNHAPALVCCKLHFQSQGFSDQRGRFNGFLWHRCWVSAGPQTAEAFRLVKTNKHYLVLTANMTFFGFWSPYSHSCYYRLPKLITFPFSCAPKSGSPLLSLSQLRTNY